MRRPILWLLLVTALASALPAQQTRSVLLVLNKREDTCSFLDLDSGRELGKTTTGRGPHEVAVTPDGRRAYATNYEGSDTISVIDVVERRELRQIPLAPHRRPHGIVITRDGRRAIVTCEGSRTVIELDLERETIAATYSTEANGSHMVALSPDERHAYVANIGSGSLTVIDRVARRVVAQIPCAPGTEGVAVSPDGRFVWTANNRANSLSIVDTRAHRVVETLPCADFPIRVQLTPDGRRALVSCARSNDVAVFDTVTRKETHRIATGTAPVGLLILPDGKRALVANTAANRIALLDLVQMKVSSTLTAGREPDGMALASLP